MTTFCRMVSRYHTTKCCQQMYQNVSTYIAHQEHCIWSTYIQIYIHSSSQEQRSSLRPASTAALDENNRSCTDSPALNNYGIHYDISLGITNLLFTKGFWENLISGSKRFHGNWFQLECNIIITCGKPIVLKDSSKS